MNDFYTADEVKGNINAIAMNFDDGILNPIERAEIVRIIFYVVYTDFIGWKKIDQAKLQVMRSYDFNVFLKQIINSVEKREVEQARCGFVPMFLMIDLLDTPWPHLKYERIFEGIKTKYTEHLERYRNLIDQFRQENKNKQDHHERRMAELRQTVKAEREEIIREGKQPPALWPY